MKGEDIQIGGLLESVGTLFLITDINPDQGPYAGNWFCVDYFNLSQQIKGKWFIRKTETYSFRRIA